MVSRSFIALFTFLFCVINYCRGSCYEATCMNEGYCDTSKNRCICPYGFGGERCETNMRYMLDECSTTFNLDTDETFVMKSQSTKYMPPYAKCNVQFYSPFGYQILVNIIEFRMHNNCDFNYLNINNEEKLCGGVESQKSYVVQNSYAYLYLELNGDPKDEHLGFIISISLFSSSDEYPWYRPNICDFQCTNGGCISSLLYNNGFDNCGDGSDEPSELFCNSQDYYCSNRCIPKDWICDCNADCTDSTDEWGCDCKPEEQCDDDHFWCYSKKMCLPNSIKCDGYSNCLNPYDETECLTTTVQDEEQCDDDHFWCYSKKMCLPNSIKCDGYSNCLNPYDETECLTTTVQDVIDNCKGAFRCDVSNCIPKEFVCDNYIDCSDESDETNCRMSNGVLIGVVVAVMLSMVCFVSATYLVVSIFVKRRRTRTRRSNIRTVSAYIPPEPRNLFTNCDIPPSYDIAVGINEDDLVKQSLDEKVEVKASEETENGNTHDDRSGYQEFIDDSHELPLIDSEFEISKTDPTNKIKE